jgi:polygalacturonase
MHRKLQSLQKGVAWHPAILALCLLAPLQLLGQLPGSTFLDDTRRIDWTSAGFSIPSYTVNCATQLTGGNALVAGSGAAAGNATKIQTALNSCDATHNVVLIPAGTWYTQGITFGTQGKQVLRGVDPNSTKLFITTSAGCGGLQAGICMSGANATYSGDSAVLPPSGTRQCTWAGTNGSAGTYTKGATTLNLTACGGTPPNGQTLVLDQANDSSDTGGVYICDGSVANCNGEGPGSYVGRTISGKVHTETQVTHITGVTSIGGGAYTVTISPGLYFNNVRTSQTPGVWWNGFSQFMGLENLTIDRTGFFNSDSNVAISNADKVWLKNVRSMWAGRNHVWVYLSSNAIIRDSYFYQDQSHASESYGIEMTQASGVLIENNIFQQVSVPTMFGPGSGTVVSYNLDANNAYPAPNLALANASHSAGNQMNLWEGNIAPGIQSDASWGGSATGTWFRNFLTGWQTGYNQYTYPVSMLTHNRAFNVVGNVLGQPSYQTSYEGYATSTTGGTNGGNAVNTTIYNLGWTGYAGWGGCDTNGGTTGCDSLVRPTLMRWGNWDVVTNATKFDSTEAAPGAVPYVAANFSSGYFGTLAHTLPASLVYASAPSWWPAGKAWPPIGPDVTGGNVGRCTTGSFIGSQATTRTQCGGTLTASWSNLVTSIPAFDCAKLLGMPPDGSGGPLAFDAAACATSTPQVATPTFSPATGTYTTAQTVSIFDSTAGAQIFYTTNGSAPTTASTPYSAPFIVSATTTVKAFAVKSGFADSAIASAVYTISPGFPVATVATGDTRTITEPTFPVPTATFKATKFIAKTTTLNVDPYNPTCGGPKPNGTLGCTGGTSYEPSSSSSSYVAAETLDNTAFNTALASCNSTHPLEVIPGDSGQLGIVLAPWSIPNGCKIILDAGIVVYASRNRTDYGGTNCGLISTASSSCNHWITSPGTTGAGIYGYGILFMRSWDIFIPSSAPANMNQGFYYNRVQSYINKRGSATDGSPAGTKNALGNNSYGPNGLNLVGANNFTLYKTTIKDTGNFIFNWQSGNGMTAWGAKLIAPFEVSNTDGWDPLNSVNGTFTQGVISNGDNHVAIKAKAGPSQNLTISNTQLGAGIAIAIGTDQAAGVSNVLATNIVGRGNLNNKQGTLIQIGSSTANGGSVNQVTFRNFCGVNYQNGVRLYTNYGGQTGTSTPNYTNWLLQNIHILPSTAPYTTGNSGTYTFQGLNGTPIAGQIDNFAIDGTNQGIASQSGVTKDQYTQIHLGPGPVASSLISQFAVGTSALTSGTPGTGAPYPCTTAMWKPLVGDLNLKTATSNNNQSYTHSSPAPAYTLQAVLQPATEINNKESAALTQPVSFLDNGVSIGTAPLAGDGSFASFTVTPPSSGTHVYTAQYPGDSNYPVFAFGSVTVTIDAPLVCADPTQLDPNTSGSYIVPPTTLPMTVGFVSPTSGCAMHYTSDGSTPTCSSTAYPGGDLSIASVGTYTYRAIACQAGYTTSAATPLATWTVTNASPIRVVLTGTQAFSGQGSIH